MSTEPSKEDIKRNVKATSTWMRLIYMVLYVACYVVAEIILSVMVVFQFLHTLILGEPNKNLLGFTSSLSTYFFQVIRFLTFNNDEKPFPFGEWPEDKS